MGEQPTIDIFLSPAQGPAQLDVWGQTVWPIAAVVDGPFGKTEKVGQVVNVEELVPRTRKPRGHYAESFLRPTLSGFPAIEIRIMNLWLGVYQRSEQCLVCQETAGKSARRSTP